MKNILILTSAAVFAAFLILPVNGEITGSLSFIATLALVLNADYGQPHRREVGARVRAGAKRESLRLAA